MNAISELRGSVCKPASRKYYVFKYFDPSSGRRMQRSTRSTDRREAYAWALQLATKIVDGSPNGRTPWDAFCDLYERHLTANRSAKTLEAWQSAKHQLCQYKTPRFLEDANSTFILLWQCRMETKDLTPTSISSYSTRLRAAMGWAATHDMIAKVPVIYCAVCNTPRSRAVSAEEFNRLLAVAKAVRPDDYRIERFIRGLWESGLRLSELYQLSWDTDSPIYLDTTGRFPVIVFSKGSHKGQKAYVQPITPELWAVCCETPREERQGAAFPVEENLDKIGRLISWCGGDQLTGGAGIVTNTETGKHASAHDLRRSFAKRMKGRVPRSELGKWTRHSDDATLETYYLQTDAQELAERLWANQPGDEL